jgi:GTP cyclohydrolase I
MDLTTQDKKTSTVFQFNQLDLIETAETSEKAAYNEQVAYLIKDLLAELGEDPDREGLRRTPERVARAFDELLAGYRTDPVAMINGALFESDYDDIVMVRDIDFFSLCEHHMLPFYGRAHVAYIPDGKVVGLSKIPRAVEMYARRLQIQERLTQEIAEFLEAVLQPRGVAVIVEAAHMCAMMRGVKKGEAHMVTRSMRGAFQTDAELRRELMNQLQCESGNAASQ